MLELYLGGARSGKSRLAEQQAIACGKKLIYVATAEAGDGEMRSRIDDHRSRRDQRWQTVEEPLLLAQTLLSHNCENNCIVVDCLTLWLTNLLLADDERCFAIQRECLLACLSELKARVIFVSNEVGQGVVPADPLSRRFVDESGFLHQQLAARCDRTVFTTAGIPHVLKGDNLTGGVA